VDRLIAIAAAIPALLAALWWLGVLAIAGATGVDPIWTTQPASLAEAAALRDAAAVARYVSHGVDPDEPGDVRAHVISDEALRVTPLEAAVGTRDRDMVQFLIDEGAAVDAAAWTRAWCAGAEAEVRGLLLTYRPDGASDQCPR
jgi:hypothetical protein